MNSLLLLWQVDLLHQPLRLLPDSLEPLVVQVVLVKFLYLVKKEGLLDRTASFVEGVHKQEDLATEGRQPNAAGIVCLIPGFSDL
ncbi:hypothetical protein FCIRC_4903 [Fusarium circinatum]|uniref:Uncharacterized protein n=1 Tax=Fusarium circinatum TaxID=48490 RepID=A0A8H5X5Z9_FUSCI|nr:hypothetical protein FCIRC_4903 [Fusarium circinatum]